MTAEPIDPTIRVLSDLEDERLAQDDPAALGETRRHGTGHPNDQRIAEYLEREVNATYGLEADGNPIPDGDISPPGPSWRELLVEDVGQAFAATELPDLRARLIEAAGRIVTWVEQIDRQITAGQTTVDQPETAPHLGPIGLLPTPH
ncbi:hypothetical protein [Amycolatopsis sp. NPDC058986]|uniref:hypothetical protein n=1 Tax=unclassified Amycolatopsis TaxID=2618356 RepID=UPI00366E3F35